MLKMIRLESPFLTDGNLGYAHLSGSTVSTGGAACYSLLFESPFFLMKIVLLVIMIACTNYTDFSE